MSEALLAELLELGIYLSAYIGLKLLQNKRLAPYRRLLRQLLLSLDGDDQDRTKLNKQHKNCSTDDK